MRRRALTTLVAAVAVAAAASAGAAAATTTTGGDVKITQAAGAQFPERLYVVSLPAGRRLGASDVTVLEDGKPVSDVRVTPVGEARGRQFGIVLAIDASESMKGPAIASALAAARAFATHKSPNQRLAVLLFNNKVVVRLPFTADPAKIQAALVKQPTLLYGTRIYDAVDRGVAMLSQAKIAAGSVIVLSDGSDLGSKTSLATAAQHARDAHVRLFTVGLRSRFYDGTALKALAVGAGGVSAEAATPKQLRAIYDALGSQLSREYFVRYRSFALPNKPVNVTVTVNGLSGSATSGYRSPKLALPAVTSEPYQEPVSRKIWTSGWTMLVVALIAAGLAALVLLAIVRQFPHGAVRSRIGEFVSLPGAAREGKRPSAQLTARVLEGTERAFGRTAWWTRFKLDLEIAQIRMAPAQIVVLTILGTVAAMWVLTIVSGTFLLGLLGLGVPFAVRGFVRFKLDRLRRQFGEQLPENLQVLASALRAGHSFLGAMAVVVDDSAEPTQTEFRRIVADEQLGIPVEEGLETVAERMQSRELEQVALVAALQRQAGGNTAEVLDRVTETLRERQELRRTVRTLTAQGRLSRWIVSALPIGLLLFISLVNPDYMSVLYTSTIGRILLAFSAMLIIAGSLVIRKIINIKV